MLMLKKDRIKELSKLLSMKGVDSTKIEITPFRDWRIVVIFFVAGLVLSVGFNVYMSIGINQDSFFAAAPKSGESTVFNRDGLAKVLARFAEKEALFEKTRTEKSNIVDPSR